MQWARVPEAPINKDGNALLGKDDVRATPQGRHRSDRNSVSHALRMKKSSHGQLRAGIA